tara:strand:- start:2378 stop:2647 length:270 start_codon:yes stop_codon:yes gene_type:complete
MCGGGGGGQPAPPPPPDPRIAEQAAEKRARERRVALNEKSRIKDEAFETAVQDAYGRKNRRSLLSSSSRKGGEGFQVASDLMSKTTLGA